METKFRRKKDSNSASDLRCLRITSFLVQICWLTNRSMKVMYGLCMLCTLNLGDSFIQVYIKLDIFYRIS